MPLAPARARHRRVRDLAHEPVLERVLLLALDPRDGLAADQAALLERAEQLARSRRCGSAAARAGRARRPCRPRRRRAGSRARPARARRGAPRGCSGSSSAASSRVVRAALGDDGGELLDEQRVALRGRGETLGVVACARARQQLRRELRASPAASGSSESAVARERPPPHAGRSAKSSGRVERDESRRTSSRPRAQHLDQVEQARIGPVDVLEDEQRRLVARDAARRIAAPRRRGSRGRPARRSRSRAGAPGSRSARVAVGDAAPSFSRATSGIVVVEDPARPASRAARRRRRPSCRRTGASGRASGTSAAATRRARELLGEPALADPGRADDGHEVRTALRRTPAPRAGPAARARARGRRAAPPRACAGRRARRRSARARPRSAQPFPWRSTGGAGSYAIGGARGRVRLARRRGRR